MPFFDLHCHPSFKTSLAKRDIGDASNPFTNVDVNVEIVPVDEIMGDPLDSQSSITQLLGGGVNLAVVAIYVLENAYTKSCLIKWLNKLTDDLSRELVEAIRLQLVSYQDLFDRELQHLHNHQRPKSQQVAGQALQYQLINSIDEYDQADLNTLYLILAAEGGHCFYPNQVVNQQKIEDILQRLTYFKTPGNPRLLYITMVHHAQNDLANHAFAVPATWAGNGTNNGAGGFNPIGKPLADWGEQFIRKALSTENGLRRILIDVKHLSLAARMKYYEIREREFPEAPIIASHMGVTGLSYNDVAYRNNRVIRWAKEFSNDPQCYEVRYNVIESFRFEYPSYDINVCFNPWSINLYDEEIVYILMSGGLIGLSFDVRILGFPDSGVERVSKNDLLPSLKHFLAHPPAIPTDDNFPPDDTTHPSLNHIWYLCNNLLHIVKIGLSLKTQGVNGWDHICFGSDYDGLIVALRESKTAESLPQFREKLRKNYRELPRLLGLI